MCCEVVIHTAELAEPPAMDVLHRGSGVVVLHPHAHAHVLHLEQLPARDHHWEVLVFGAGKRCIAIESKPHPQGVICMPGCYVSRNVD